jgi:hypothetical protein
MLRKKLNLGYKKEIPLRRLADRNDMLLGFLGWQLCHEVSWHNCHPYLYKNHVIPNEEKRNEESQINLYKNLFA